MHLLSSLFEQGNIYMRLCIVNWFCGVYISLNELFTFFKICIIIPICYFFKSELSKLNHYQVEIWADLICVLDSNQSMKCHSVWLHEAGMIFVVCVCVCE